MTLKEIRNTPEYKSLPSTLSKSKMRKSELLDLMAGKINPESITKMEPIIVISENKSLFTSNSVKISLSNRFLSIVKKKGAIPYSNDSSNCYVFGPKFSLKDYVFKGNFVCKGSRISIVNMIEVRREEESDLVDYLENDSFISDRLYSSIVFIGKSFDRVMNVYVHYSVRSRVDGIILDTEYLYQNKAISNYGNTYDKYENFPSQEDIMLIGKQPEKWDLDKRIPIPEELNSFEYVYEANGTLDSVRRWFYLPDEYILKVFLHDGDYEVITFGEYKREYSKLVDVISSVSLSDNVKNCMHDLPLVDEESIKKMFIYNPKLMKKDLPQIRLNGRIVKVFKAVNTRSGLTLKTNKVYK